MTKFNKNDFICSLINGLFEAGIDTIKLDELERDLYLYAIDDKHSILFTDIEIINNRVNLSDIIKYLNCREKNDLKLTYLMGYIKKSSTYLENYLMTEMLEEIVIRKRIEQNSNTHLRIYGIDPNTKYNLNNNEGINNNYHFITDGELEKENNEVTVNGATYVIIRYYLNDQISNINLFTTSLDEQELKGLVAIANFDKPLKLTRFRED